MPPERSVHVIDGSWGRVTGFSRYANAEVEESGWIILYNSLK